MAESNPAANNNAIFDLRLSFSAINIKQSTFMPCHKQVQAKKDNPKEQYYAKTFFYPFDPNHRVPVGIRLFILCVEKWE